MIIPSPQRWPPSLLILAAFFFFYTCACLYGTRHFYRDPGSIFFDQSRAFERHYSTYRSNQALDYVTLVKDKAANVSGARAGEHPRMCMTILTAARDLSSPSLSEHSSAKASHPDTAYLELVIGSVLANLTSTERADLSLQVFFVNSRPQIHQSYNAPWVKQVADEIYTSADIVSPDVHNHLAALETKKDWHAKSITDYTNALKRCYDNTTAPYIAVLEGDVLVADGYLAHTLLSLQTVEVRMAASGKRDKWLDLRLFNQERSTGFESRAWTGNNVPAIVSCVAVALCGMMLLLRGYWRKTCSWIDNPTIAVICLIIVPATVVLFFQAGKASVLTRSPGVYEEGYGCCSQFLVFNRQIIPELTGYLQRSASTENYDMITRDFGREAGLTRWAQYPMLTQHLGFSSILTANRPVDQIVWSMAAENIDPRRQERDHERSVKELYGDAAWPG